MNQGQIVSTVDAFVTKLDGSGKLVYSTYLGGNTNELAFGIAVDKSGSAYITGRTVSSNFPVKNPFQASLGGQGDAFLTKLNSKMAQGLFIQPTL